MKRDTLLVLGFGALMAAGGLAWLAPVIYGRVSQEVYFSTPGGIALAEMAGDAAGWRAALVPGIGAGLLVLVAACLFVVVAVRNRAAE